MREFRCKERAVFSPVSPVRFCSLPTLPYPTATTTLLSTAAVQTLGQQQQQQQLTVRQLNEFSYRFSLSLSFSFLLFFFRPCFAGLSLHVYSLVRRGIGRQKRQTNVCAPAPTAHTHTLLTHWERDCSLSAGEYSFFSLFLLFGCLVFVVVFFFFVVLVVLVVSLLLSSLFQFAPLQDHTVSWFDCLCLLAGLPFICHWPTKSKDNHCTSTITLIQTPNLI